MKIHWVGRADEISIKFIVVVSEAAGPAAACFVRIRFICDGLQKALFDTGFGARALERKKERSKNANGQNIEKAIRFRNTI